MSLRRFAVALVMVAIVGVGTIVGRYLYLRRYAYPKSRAVLQQAKETFDRDLNKIPVGSSKQRALEFLTSHRLSHYEYDQYHSADPWYSGAVRLIEGSTTDMTRTPIADCRMFVEFKFDKAEELLGYRDRWFCSETILF